MVERKHLVAISLLLVSLGGVTGWAGPSPRDLQGALAHPQRYVDAVGADAAAVSAVCGLIWLVLAWLAAGLALTAASGLPGAAGRLCDVLASRALPTALRRAATAALGISIATSSASLAVAGPPSPPALAAAATTTATVAAATVPQPAHAAQTRAQPPSPSVDWPTGDHTSGNGTDPQQRLPSITDGEHRGRAPEGTSAAGRRPDRPTTRRPIVVRAGDCLWDIAARGLGPGASTADIATAWPRWYAANRSLIGPDPNLIMPGQRLTPPAPTRSTSRRTPPSGQP